MDNLAAGVTREVMLQNYAALTDIDAALAYAAQVDARGHRGFAAGNRSLKFKVDEHLPTEIRVDPSWSGLRSEYGFPGET